MQFKTTKEVAKRLEVSPRRVQQLAILLNIKPERVGNVDLYNDAQFLRMSERNTKRGPKAVEKEQK